MWAQKAPAIGDELQFYAETKQVNQFFKRFNSEESVDGKRLYPGDAAYRSIQGRNKYLPILFDLQNKGMTADIKQAFINDVNGKVHPQFLNFHGGQWFAEADVTVNYQGKEQKATVYLKLQEEKVGSKWVLIHVKFEPFRIAFKKDKDDKVHFLHPLSHEVEFLPLYKALALNKRYAENYTDREFYPDYLTLFIYEIKQGRMAFKAVNDVKFHFFQVQGWYFELSNFNRAGNNSGWLISRLVKATDKEKEELIKSIYLAL